MDLKAFLVKPVQRLCKYPLLLKELVKVTDANHPDHSNLEKALSKVESVVASINDKKRKVEEQERLMKAAESITAVRNRVILSVYAVS